MKITNMALWTLVVVAALGLGTFVLAANNGPSTPKHEDMVLAAQKFLEALGPGPGARAVFPFESEERFSWHFVPNEMYKRTGVSLKEMTIDQRKAAHALLRSALSSQGYLKVTSIMQLEAVLREIEDKAGTRRFDRDQELYWFRIFGTPSNDMPWGWSVTGHHLSLNFSSVTNELIATTPMFTGSNPAHVLEGSRAGLRILGGEENLARALLASLDESQRTRAIFSAIAPRDIYTENARKVNLEKPIGLPVSEMNENQRSLLMRLLAEYIQNLRPDLAHNKLEKIKNAGIEKIYFAWAGSAELGKEHYYRVQGPTLLIEYDNTQNNGNHIHAVVRDPEEDFGVDLLRKHYEESAHHQNQKS
jgi:hypothetical protein